MFSPLPRNLPELPPASFIDMPGGFRTACFRLGPADGPGLVLCHGLAANGLQFVADAHHFARQGFNVIVPDLRGHGRSTRPARCASEHFSHRLMAGDLLAVLDKDGIARADWVGNSLGGVMALVIMKLAPERLGRVVTFGTSYSLEVSPVWRRLAGMLRPLIESDPFARFGAARTCRAPDARAVVHAMLLDIDVHATLCAAANLESYDLVDSATGFPRPILMIRGTLDGIVNERLAPLMGRLERKPDFTHLDLPGAGHCANLDRPDDMRRLILEFLGPATR